MDTNQLCDTKESIEVGLTRVLRLAERWKAVALLDEADIFLEPRSQNDVRRNSMVTGSSTPQAENKCQLGTRWY